jgi:hypothetical protein
MDAFWRAAARPATPALLAQAFDSGFQQRTDVELNLGEFVGTNLADPSVYPNRWERSPDCRERLRLAKLIAALNIVLVRYCSTAPNVGSAMRCVAVTPVKPVMSRRSSGRLARLARGEEVDPSEYTFRFAPQRRSRLLPPTSTGVSAAGIR